MGLWRCYNGECSEHADGRLGFDFEADTPTCPKCGANPSMPEHRHTIVKREIIHFLVADKKGPLIGRGCRYRVACDPAMTKPGHATGECVATSCPRCIKSAEFIAAALGQGFVGSTPKVVDEPEMMTPAKPETLMP